MELPRGPFEQVPLGAHMTTLAKVNLSNALILALLGLVVAESAAVASQRTSAMRTQDPRIVTASPSSRTPAETPFQNREIVVRRQGAPTIVFTDASAIAFQLTLTRADIDVFEAALAKDLAHGDFRARETQRVVGADHHQAAQSAADELLSARRELGRLKQALREDLADGDFDAPHTRREVAGHDPVPSVAGNEALASGAVSVSDEFWSLKMAVEKDLHARDFRAIETHFVIDGRRWKVN